jgi:hypothetical protein
MSLRQRNPGLGMLTQKRDRAMAISMWRKTMFAAELFQTV